MLLHFSGSQSIFKRDKSPPRELAVADSFDDYRCDDYISIALAKEGVRVVLAERTREKLKEVKKEICNLEGNCLSVPTNMSREMDLMITHY